MFIQLTKDFLGRKAGERIDVSEADAQQLTKDGVASAVTDDVITPAVSKAMEQAFTKFTQALDGVIDAQLKAFGEAQKHARKNAEQSIFGPYSDGQDPKGRSFGDWLLCVRTGNEKRLGEVYGSQKTAMSTGTGTAGGYLVPTEFIPELMMLAAEQSIVRPRATLIPMTAKSVQIPALDLRTDPSAGDTQFFGGLAAAWTEEAATLTEDEPSFKQVEITAYELAGYSLVSNSLIADSAIGLEVLLKKLFGGALAWYQDYAFLRGNGVGKPLGVTEAACAISVSRSSATTFKLVDAAKMLGQFLPGWRRKNSCWIVSPSVLQQLIQMVDTGNNAISIPNSREELPMELFGLPVLVSEKLPELGTAKDVVLANFQHYLVGDRQQVEIAFSEHYKFTNNQGTWRFVSRVGGQPWLAAAVNLAGQTSTVSPFVYLT